MSVFVFTFSSCSENRALWQGQTCVCLLSLLMSETPTCEISRVNHRVRSDLFIVFFICQQSFRWLSLIILRLQLLRLLLSVPTRGRKLPALLRRWHEIVAQIIIVLSVTSYEIIQGLFLSGWCGFLVDKKQYETGRIHVVQWDSLNVFNHCLCNPSAVVSVEHFPYLPTD